MEGREWGFIFAVSAELWLKTLALRALQAVPSGAAITGLKFVTEV